MPSDWLWLLESDWMWLVKLRDPFLLLHLPTFNGWKWWFTKIGPCPCFRMPVVKIRLRSSPFTLVMQKLSLGTGKSVIPSGGAGDQMDQEGKTIKIMNFYIYMWYKQLGAKIIRPSIDFTHPWIFPLNVQGLGLCPRAFTALPSPTILGYVTW